MFRWGAKLGMSRVLLSEAYESDRHGGACLPVLERKQCDCLKSPSEGRFQSCGVNLFYFFLRKDGRECVLMSCGARDEQGVTL